MNVDDIRNVVFDKTMRGYRMEEVDAFLAQVAAEFEKLTKEKEDLEKKLYILAEKVDQYRNDEDTLKTALLNAQRMGESVIYEARQKAETIIYDANTKASQAKDEANQHVADMEQQLNRLKAEVAGFKGSVLDLYRQHIELLGNIPGEERAPRRESAPSPIVSGPARKPAPEQKKAEARAEGQSTPEQPAQPAEKGKKKAQQDSYRTIAFDFDEEDEDLGEEPFDEEEYEDDLPLDGQMERTPFDEDDDEEEEFRAAKPSDMGDYQDITFD